MDILLSGNVYEEDLKYVNVGQKLKFNIAPFISRITDYHLFLSECEKSDLVIFRLCGLLPNKFIEDLKSLNLLSRFLRLPCKKVLWSQDSHHAYKSERQFQDYFDRIYVAHSPYLCKFNSLFVKHLPCCYTASSIDFLLHINSLVYEKRYDVGSFYVQYQIGKRNIYFSRVKSILNKMELKSLFGKLYGKSAGIPYGNLLYGLKSTNVIINLPTLDDLNIRNFESIALDCNLLTMKVPDHDLVDVDYSNTFFFKEDFSDFEEQLFVALENKNHNAKAWMSIVNGHTLLHRYLEIINQELCTNFSLNIQSAAGPDACKKIFPKLDSFDFTDIIVYSDENIFANSFLSIVNTGGTLEEIIEIYKNLVSSKPGFNLDVSIKCIQDMGQATQARDRFVVFFTYFLINVGKSDLAIAYSRSYRLDNLCEEFFKFYSINIEKFTSVALNDFNKSIFDSSLKAIGILNYKNNEVSGENFFVNNYLNRVDCPIVFDVGANTGGYSSIVKNANRSAIVYAFEPNPVAYARLKTNSRANGFFALNFGISDIEGSMTLYDRSDIDGSQHASVYESVITEIHKQNVVAHTVKATTIDALVLSLDLKKIDLLKISTEGHEYNALLGARHSIANNIIRAVHFEFNEMNVLSRVFMKDFYDILSGFVFFRMLPDGLLPLGAYRALTHELFAYQNIVALNKLFLVDR